MTQWEYKTISVGGENALSEKELNEAGKESWELVTVIQLLVETDHICPAEIHYIFKRPTK